MHVGVPLAKLHPAQVDEITVAADELGYESVWASEHLVLPVLMEGELRPGETHPPIPHDAPVLDVFAQLAWLAARTTRIRLGTYVYLLAIRHPFIGARGFATLDVLSGGRAIAGVGAGWLTTEWEAAGLSPEGRGARLDEAIGITRRLWTEDTVSHHGACWSFPSVGFAPKPVQPGGPPILVGGESTVAMRRAVTLGDGWIAMDHTLAEARALVRRFHEVEVAAGREPGTTPITIGASDVREPEDLAAWAALGVDRVLVAPWSRTRAAATALTRLAEGLDGGTTGGDDR